MNFPSLYFSAILISYPLVYSIGQTDLQLRNPEYLIEQYNLLVAKHNALIEKTRVIITEKLENPTSNPQIEDKLRRQVNEAMGNVSVLENELSKIKEQGLRTNTSNQYLDDTNARLRKQLLEIIYID